ncbi:hypothetical protein DO021_20490 [Desulfobacter hydrogenophilus]|uniref:DUF2787 domain-containing protein n=1 Tax=Desulfobacter hydrogenophilus TaxID=2291 RepID=A0A328FAM6_9BACT|nr:DUF2787 family protein [Desulfobacter hydrogenophilus]NDY74252.1 DUF2787 domain-containing protein [Desulfobacter hydrogenophilus]QBH14572.1 DUF2787 domain-containing protein [Desulfobacter hydrogenophilus]RAM00175.1 hypothetical protein DO021_20490 [Desulfobacter hydrogenophilus]
MNIQQHTYPLPVSESLLNILEQEIQKSDVSGNHPTIVNFRDPKYSPETGGFHPVEVMVSATGEILYITDFAYVGYPAELAKDIDFDFSMGVTQCYGQEYSICQNQTLFNIWQENFCCYYDMGIYKISVTEVK